MKTVGRFLLKKRNRLLKCTDRLFLVRRAMFQSKKLELPDRTTALPDREMPLIPTEAHSVLKRSLLPPYPEECTTILFGMGCFWGAERLFWKLDSVYVTAVGYAGGITANPSYQDVCSGLTGHTEVVLVVYDPGKISTKQLLGLFWESHDPTQGMRQGNDVGSQYRSAIYCCSDEQYNLALLSRDQFQKSLKSAGYKQITTEIRQDIPFYFAETYHQQYLAKNPGGYCGLAGTGVSCPA